MRWDERQRAMLQEMGLRVWADPSPDVAAEAPADVALADAVAPEPAPTPVPAVRADAAPTAGERPARVALPERGRVEAAEALAPVRGPRALGTESMDWPALREAVSGCTACKLCQGRRNTVFRVGNERPHWRSVGEAAGE